MKKMIIRLIKFMILVAIFYALLAMNIFNFGEKISPDTKEYLDINIPTENKMIDEVYFGEKDVTMAEIGHFAEEIIYDERTENICKKVDICNKISFYGTYSSYDRYRYTQGVTTLVNFIDTHGSQKIPISEVIKRIYINNDIGQRRGYATWDTIIINLGEVQSQREFAGLLTHEMGHVADLGYIQGTSSRKHKEYTEFGNIVFAINDPSIVFYRISWNSETIRKAEAKKNDFCSGYGMSNPFEDFAECFNLYLNHNILFREMAKNNTIMKKKYNFMAAIMNAQYIASDAAELNLVKTNETRRPRDTTKITN